MCFAPQRRALFRHLNFQKWSEPGVFCTFWLGNVLRATTACTFSTSQVPKVVRTPSVLNILTWKCASRHNGVQFLISPLASWLRTRRFSEPTFRPSGASNHWKNRVNRDFPTFSRISIFFLLTLSLLLFSLLIFIFSRLPLPCSAFHLSILSEVWLLNFLRTNILKMGWTPQPDTISNLNLKSLYVHVEEIPGSLVRVGVHILQCYNSIFEKTSTSESSEQQAPKQITRFERQRFQTCQDQLSCPSPDSETAGMKCTIWIHRVATSAKPSGSSARGLQVSQKSAFYFKRPLFHIPQKQTETQGRKM